MGSELLEPRGGNCYPKAVVGVNLLRIHSRNPWVGWTRQKVFHLMIGFSNIGYFIYFVLTLVAACKHWRCWSQSCGFIVMAFPKILFVAAFLLLLSFWVDLCHQSTDDDEDEGSPQEVLLEKRNKTASIASDFRNCCSFRLTRVGSRQKVVILVTFLVLAIMIASSALIWIGMGKNPIDSAVVAQIYVDLMAITVILLGGALAFYGIKLFMKMRRVRFEQSSSELWKVAGLASVSIICFTSSASVAIATNIPLFYHWQEKQMDSIYTSLLLVLYYFIGASVPSGFLLYVMRELPPLLLTNTDEETATIAFINDSSMTVQQQHSWTAATSMQNQVSKASPI